MRLSLKDDLEKIALEFQDSIDIKRLCHYLMTGE